VVLCGPSGTGKSHLALGVASARSNSLCVHGADFARQLAAAVDSENVAEFQFRYRTADLLVLEDLTQLSGRRAALLELQHTLDALEAREAQAVITCRVPLSELKGLPAALRSRLNGGLVARLSAPGVEAREIILRRLADARGMAISPAAIRLLAERLNVTAAELRGVVMELEVEKAEGRRQKAENNESSFSRDAESAERSEAGDIETAEIDIELVRRYLAARQMRFRPTIKQICAVVAKFYGLTPAKVCSSSRRQQTVLARSLAIYLGRVLSGLSLQALGKHFGGRDHTTALHSYRSI
jgi:chromosomal replication initiator protein